MKILKTKAFKIVAAIIIIAGVTLIALSIGSSIKRRNDYNKLIDTYYHDEIEYGYEVQISNFKLLTTTKREGKTYNIYVYDVIIKLNGKVELVELNKIFDSSKAYN